MADSSEEIGFKTNAPVYSAKLKFIKEEDGYVTFGDPGQDEGWHYPDGVPVESHFTFNKWLWERAGKPDEIVVMFSADEFAPIPTASLLRLMGAADGSHSN